MTTIFRRLVPSLIALQCVIAIGCGQSAEVRKQRFLESGNRYFEQGKYREAAIEFRNAIQIDPRFPDARLKLAQTQQRLGDTEGAYNEYVRAADLLPDNLDVQLTAGNYLLAARQFEDAKLRAESVLKKDERNVQAQVLLGNALAGLRDFEQAITEIEQAIQLDPTRGATYANLGVVEMNRGRADKAEAAFKQSISLQPNWVPGRLALANHYWATGRVADAEQELLTALKLEPANPVANRALALLYIGTKRAAAAEPYAKALVASGAAPFALADFYLLQNRPQDAIPELRRLRSESRIASLAGHRLARAYALGGDRSGAQRVVTELLAENPKDPDGLLLNGQLLAAQGKNDEALSQLKMAAEINPHSAPVQFALGRLHVARSDYEAARRAFAEVLRLNPRAAAAQVELARLDLATGNVNTSIQSARDAVRNEPANLDAQVTLIRGLIAARELTEADARLKPLLAAYPKNATLHVQRGFLAAAQRDAGQARRSFEEALALDANAVAALGALVGLDIGEGKIAVARARVAARLSADPNRPELLLISARVAATAKDFAAAERDLKRALELDPNFLAGYKTLGEVYIAQGKLADARRELESLAARQPTSVVAYTMLGMLAQAGQDTSGAQRHYEHALELDPTAAVAANNLAWMYAERQENLERALQLATVAAKALPKAPEVQDTLGWVHYRMRANAEALAALGQAVKLAPNVPTYHYHLGLAQIQAGHVADGRRSVQRALESGAPFPDAGQAKRTLAELAGSASPGR